MMVCFVERLT